jgi:hypothetical protein
MGASKVPSKEDAKQMFKTNAMDMMTFNHFLKDKLFYLISFFLIVLNQFCIAGENVLLKDPPLNFSLKAEVVAVLPFFGEGVFTFTTFTNTSSSKSMVSPRR